ncbi:hypothetical protein C1J03_02880 [Sulfitobacter sp. SK012]|uniref:sulfite exporter TauE/SafE family protein n=1 Tax=Sulfitobacter sp. SK012 TaxID=1389005 RepID=UPI000E0A1F68|nr:sulfite exporter TauE/SafE family protein [Sulfitobacter sp. SK012]AXI45071.1 hypothetical protein C1J03_02880 [Sulfitobacter sp. SK012]
METLFPLLTPAELAIALLVGVVGGIVKGVVGFAMPLVLISGLTIFISPELALAGLILPTLFTNGIQALRQGPVAAWQSTKRFGVFLIFGGVMLVIAAQFVRVFPEQVMLLVIGIPVTFFALLQLSGYQFKLDAKNKGIEACFGMVAGTLGGLSGIWGPPTVAYLTALDTPKQDQMRIQGVVYGLGALALVGAHMGSGVLRGDTWGFSAAMILPATVGMWIGSKIMDNFDQGTFRRATLCVLLLAGANLIRRGILG